MIKNEIKPPPYFDWQKMPQQWSCCIKKQKFYQRYFKQTPCNNQKCPSIYCHRGRSIKRYKHLYLNYYLNPPTYAIGFNFKPNSDILNQEEALYLRAILVKEIKKLHGLGWDIFNEWDKKEQIHWHGTSTLQKNHQWFNDKKKFLDFLTNAFDIATKKTALKFYKNIIPDNVYCSSIWTIKGLSKYYAKAEEYVIKHNPRPMSWDKRMRHSLFSTDYYEVHFRDVDKYLRDWRDLYKQQEVDKVESVNSVNLEINSDNIGICKSKLSIKELILGMSWGFVLILSLMFIIKKLDLLPVNSDKDVDFKFDQYQRSRFMTNWFVQNGVEYYQIE